MPGPSLRIPLYEPLTDLQVQAIYVWLATICSTVEVRRPAARRSQRRHDEVREQREWLLLRLDLWRETHHDAKLTAELARLQDSIRQLRHDFWLVGVSGGHQFDTTEITNAVRLMGIDLQAFEPPHWDDEEPSLQGLQNLLSVVDRLPMQRLEIQAIEENIEDHILCALMAADFAEQHETQIPVYVRPNFFTRRARDEWTQDDTRALVASIEGQTQEVEAATGDLYHLVSPDFLRNWSAHPRFHLYGAL